MQISTISIIVPVYNSEKYLDKCLNSLINQTYKNIEIICINDGSTDTSLSVIKQFRERDSRIVIVDKKNEGISIARNVGMALVSGEYVMFVDSDDWINAETCELVLDIMTKEQADVVIWPYIKEYEGNSVRVDIFPDGRKIFCDSEIDKNLHRRIVGLLDKELSHPEIADSLCTVWGKLYRKQLITDNNLSFMDTKYIGTFEDGIFNLHYFEYVRKAVYLDSHFYHYRKGDPNAYTNTYKEDLYKQWTFLFDYMQKYIVERNLNEDFSRALDNRVAFSIVGLGLNVMNAKKSTFKKAKDIREIVKTERYSIAYRKLRFTYLPAKWKLFFFFCKYELVIPLIYMIKAMNLIRRRGIT